MKILGIGNAIVDVICKVDDNFITQNNLTKGTMKLIFDDKEFKNLLSSPKIERTISGGSVANSIVGLSQLGNKVGFIGKVSDDELGLKYEEGLKSEKVEYFYHKKKEELPTGTCLILVTPDSERTMCTFLGTAGKINENDVEAGVVKNSEIIFLEGYLWDEGEPKKAFEKAINNANKVAMSLSDKFCVDRHKTHFLELVKNKLDIIFANDEILKMAMIETKEALENLDEIMSTPGLDGIYIGPADLSLAIGEKPGFDKGEDTKAYSEILRILEHAKKNNIFAGIHNGSTDYAKKMIEKGFQFVTVGADSRFISAGAKNTVENLKGTVKSELSKAY